MNFDANVSSTNIIKSLSAALRAISNNAETINITIYSQISIIAVRSRELNIANLKSHSKTAKSIKANKITVETKFTGNDLKLTIKNHSIVLITKHIKNEILESFLNLNSLCPYQKTIKVFNIYTKYVAKLNKI
jgi:isocitrate dehydrogenase kinase/phosphatase